MEATRPPKVLGLLSDPLRVEHRSAGTVEARRAGSHPKPLHPLADQAFEAVADEIESRVALLLADLRTPQLEGTHHG